MSRTATPVVDRVTTVFPCPFCGERGHTVEYTENCLRVWVDCPGPPCNRCGVPSGEPRERLCVRCKAALAAPAPSGQEG